VGAITDSVINDADKAYPAKMPTPRVAVLATPPQSLFELACAIEAFGLDRPGLPNPYDFRVCTERPGALRCLGGPRLNVVQGLRALASADTIVIAGWPELEASPSGLLAEALLRAHRRGARLVGLCFGAFLLAHLGLLDGRRATTHWREADRLARMFPQVEVDASVLYVVDGAVATSAGTGAAVDLCLELARRDLGSARAGQISRHMVLPPQREGGQRQYALPTSVPQDSSLARLLEWVGEHLHERITVADMAAVLGVSSRTLNRRFDVELGVTPGRWLTTQRLDRARALLESGDHTVETVARRAGLSSASNLRRRFVSHVATTPSAYRRTFHRLDEDQHREQIRTSLE
jgi:AraC family transcriptional regulator, transcriptional activator FtrA